MPVALVADSTAQLSVATAADRGITVVPLNVVVDQEVHEEGVDGASPEFVAQALTEHRAVSTSRPVPAVFEELYARLAAEGADEIVSVHISGEMSGTLESAQVAARTAPVPVHVVDTRQVGPATGYAVLSAADVRDAGGSGEEMARAARARAEGASSLFYVDTLEYLRRGGRIGAAAALLGSALSVKPLLTISDGKVATAERVRTSSKALARLADLAVEAAGDAPVDVVVAHLANPERAQGLADVLTERLVDGLEGREVMLSEISAVLGAHVGPGMVSVCVAPRA
ncbi:MAG: DegV family protein [Nocardioides sp.]|uniref:DegV family protein n=1 Tax=Nocardioides sp. TaxID=35761 RepID=UPI003F06ADBA